MATITEDYVSFETAKLLKEKGFDEGCSFVINAISKGVMPVSWPTTNSDIEDEKANLITLPTLQMAMKWLREVHNLCLFVIPAAIDNTFRTGYALYPQCDDRWEWCASKNDRSKATFGCDVNSKYCNSYEEACEAAIKYCLEHLI